MKDLKSVHAYEIKQLDIGSFNDCVTMDTNMTRNPSVNKDLIYLKNNNISTALGCQQGRYDNLNES